MNVTIDLVMNVLQYSVFCPNCPNQPLPVYAAVAANRSRFEAYSVVRLKLFCWCVSVTLI